MLLLVVLAIALGAMLSGARAGTDVAGGCVAVAADVADTCTVVAGVEGSGTHLPEDAVVVGERLSWLAVGNWTVDIYLTSDCSGEPFRHFDSSSNNEAGAFSNNGGGYFETCAVATAIDPGSAISIGAVSSAILP